MSSYTAGNNSDSSTDLPFPTSTLMNKRAKREVSASSSSSFGILMTDAYDSSSSSCTNPNMIRKNDVEKSLLPFVDQEGNDAFETTTTATTTIVTILDPLTSVARKSVHTMGKDDEEEDVQKPAAKQTIVAATTLESGCAKAAAWTRNFFGEDKVDRLSTLTEDVLYRITSFLAAPDLLLGLACTNQWYSQRCRENPAWDTLWMHLVSTKCHVSPRALQQQQQPHPQPQPQDDSNKTCLAYRTALEDSRRQHITLDELCYSAETGQGTVWSFRFKESAGSDWTSVDPWYQGGPCRKMVFLRDGSIKQWQQQSRQLQQPQNGDYNDDDNNNNISSMPQPQLHANISRNSGTSSTLHQQQQQDERTSQAAAAAAAAVSIANNNGAGGTMGMKPVEPVELVEPLLRMAWRFMTKPMDLPTRPMGSYVRIQVGGRDVPTYAVRRSPTGNWGFVLESCWGVYASFELPPRLVTPPLGHHNSSNALLRRRSSNDTAVWVAQEGRSLKSSSGGGASLVLRPSRRPTEADMQDDSMLLTNEVQWREAFLYNVGARDLPEGEEATDEFDTFWQGL